MQKSLYTHILITSDDNMSWCGETIVADNVPHFKDAEHAALNGRYDGKNTTCSKCTDKVVECLIKGRG